MEATTYNPFRYCGEYFDEETGFVYLRARYYDPGTQRFISEDTHWNLDNMIYGDKIHRDGEIPVPDVNSVVQSGNLYAYCCGNPVVNIDPSGNSFTAGIVAIIAIIVIALTVKSCENSRNSSQTVVRFSSPNYMSINFDQSKLQHEFKHAGDYGISGNWNSLNGELFKQSIFKQISSVSIPIQGYYRGTIAVLHYYDPETGIDTMIDMNGNFIAGWKLSAEQAANLQINGNVQ